MKTTGAKVAKFGLKVVQSVGMATSKALSFIPGVGKPLSKIVEGVSKVAGLVSDKIRAPPLSKALDKGMKVMNKANAIMGKVIPFRRDLSEQDPELYRRDVGDGYYFEERDDISLEDREEAYFDADEQDTYAYYY